MIINPTKRKESEETALIKEYEAIKGHEYIDRAYLNMQTFHHLTNEQTEALLTAVATMHLNDQATFEERLLMEIRHHIAGDGAEPQLNAGSLGSNPLAYLNVVQKGDPNYEAEFRGQIYFTFMSRKFTNLLVGDPDQIRFINQRLKDWQIDSNFVSALNARKPKNIQPLFRYGENASLNNYLRSYKINPEYYQTCQNPTVGELLNNTYLLDSPFRIRLSQRELLNQTGEIKPEHAKSDQRARFASGAAFYQLNRVEEVPSLPKAEFAKKYIQMVTDLHIPVLSGISSTMDIMATMAAFTGVAITPEALQMVKLACIAFMVPSRDHSVHEILQSAKTFGIPYVAGFGFERHICPPLGAKFLEKLDAAQKIRGYQMPSNYAAEEINQ